MSWPSVSLLIASLVSAMGAPCQQPATQGFDSTSMPPLEQLALEAGRASRRYPIRAIAPALLCEPGHPLVDSASVAACVVLSGPKAAEITAAFARGLEVSLSAPTDVESSIDYPACPRDIERVADPRIIVARVTAPVVGVYEGVWEGRLSVELRCRSPGAGNGQAIRTMGDAYLFQWIGREWKLYQRSWWRAER